MWSVLSKHIILRSKISEFLFVTNGGHQTNQMKKKKNYAFHLMAQNNNDNNDDDHHRNSMVYNICYIWLPEIIVFVVS